MSYTRPPSQKHKNTVFAGSLLVFNDARHLWPALTKVTPHRFKALLTAWLSHGHHLVYCQTSFGAQVRSAWRSEVQPDAHPRHPRPPAGGPAFGTLPGRQPLQHGATETFTCLRSPPRPLLGTPWQIRAWLYSCVSGGSEQSRAGRAPE
jgi:hypothetical protein